MKGKLAAFPQLIGRKLFSDFKVSAYWSRPTRCRCLHAAATADVYDSEEAVRHMRTILRIVDAFISDRLVGSYSVSWTLQNEPIVEQDAIELARQAMKEAGFSADQIKVAKFVVRRR